MLNQKPKLHAKKKKKKTESVPERLQKKIKYITEFYPNSI